MPKSLQGGFKEQCGLMGVGVKVSRKGVEKTAWGTCASCYSGYDLGAFSGSLHTQQARCRLEMTTYLALVSVLSGELEFG